ncbi:hypothetical protein [Aureimonas sp. SK2]|uniref:hypothetical protein n=1 Tax=Aureimonas sp. SK2 TaxID=3015992 RepID=UPI0024451ED0|nr:hypothetical protein [Aureimonas sp. SK2]
MRDEHPHSPAALGRGLDLLPGFAVLALPFAWAFWALGTPGDLSPSELEASWWFRGYVALLLYAPAMALLWLAGRLARRWGRPGLLVVLRLLRWSLFLVVFGPILLFAAAVCPPLARLLP